MKRQTCAPRVDNEPFRFVIEDALSDRRCRARSGRHDRPDAGAHDEQSALDERRNDPVRGVGINLQILAQDSNRWEWIARLQLAADDGPSDCVGHLFVNRDARAEGNGERLHAMVY